MHYNDERNNVMLVLVGLFALTMMSLIDPAFGYILLGLVGAGIVGLTVTGVILLWTTRYKPPSDDEIRAHQLTQHRDVTSR